AERVKRVPRDRLRRRPSGSVSPESRAENGRAVIVVFTLPAEEDQKKIAVAQLVEAGRMFVVARLDFRPQDALDFDLTPRKQFAEDRNCQPPGNEAKGSVDMAVAVHALRHLTACAAALQVRIQASAAWGIEGWGEGPSIKVASSPRPSPPVGRRGRTSAPARRWWYPAPEAWLHRGGRGGRGGRRGGS